MKKYEYDARFTNVSFSELKQIETLRNSSPNSSAINVRYEGNLESGIIEINVDPSYPDLRKMFLKAVLDIINS